MTLTFILEVIRIERLELSRDISLEPKSSASANSATSAIDFIFLKEYTKQIVKSSQTQFLR